MLKEIIRNLKKLNLEKEALKFLKENNNVVLDMNTQQLMEGMDSDEAAIDPFYRSPAYADFKMSLNPAGVVDLRLTGAFHDSFFMRVSKFPLTIFARDKKTKELTEKYGEQIFGLTPTNKGELSSGYILPDAKEKVMQAFRVQGHSA